MLRLPNGNVVAQAVSQELSPDALYMHQIKWVRARLNMLYGFVEMSERESDDLHVALAAESIQLQLRLTLENLALAPLAANKDAYSKVRPKYEHDWKAGLIFKALESVHPNFYPIPVVMQKTETGFHFQDRVDGYLTKDEFLEAYGACNELLHAFNPFKAQIDFRAIIERAKRWADLTAELIRLHVVEVLGYPGPLIVEVQDNQSIRVLRTAPVDGGSFTFSGRMNLANPNTGG